MKTLSLLLWWHWLIVVAFLVAIPIVWWWTDRTEKKDGKGFEKRSWPEWRAYAVNCGGSYLLGGLIFRVLLYLFFR